ncbi:MAG: cytochrome c oxidase subunit II [Gemmatimonadales bacterium]
MAQLIPEASSFAGSIDGLILLVTALAGLFLVVSEAYFFWLLFRFRARPGVKSRYLDGSEKDLKKWTISVPHSLMLVCDVFIIVFAIRVWVNVKQELPEAGAVVRVIGQQWGWIFQHPGADNRLDTADDILTTDHLYVENERTYHFQLQSRDVLHNFSVPVFRLKQDAVPGRTITGWFKPTQIGTFDIQCAEICGIGHGVMFGQIHVQDQAAHSTWVAANTPAAAR